MQKTGFHFKWSNQPIQSGNVISVAPGHELSHLAYGFSYVFNKQVWKRFPFPVQNIGEDGEFINGAFRSGIPIVLIQDDIGLCLHIMHHSNSSTVFPQYELPPLIAKKLFPDIEW